MCRSLQIALLEPYYGGSHGVFVDTLARHSRHRCTLASMPARKWKWRMRGAAIWFAHRDVAWLTCSGGATPDVILCNDMLSVADLRGMLGRQVRNVPIVCYFHENQLTYPLPDEKDRDYQYGMTNITSCLSADAVWFNSRFHMEEYLSAVGGLLRKMPDCVPSGVVEQIRGKSSVVPPPVTSGDVSRKEKSTGATMTMLWCHRWEYDKNPELFFKALLELDASGLAFELVLLGEQFRTAPPVFASSWDRLEPHIRHAGFLPNPEDYFALLSKCDVVVSTAIQENFGIGVAEAILAGCQPLLPNRLAYPELIPREFHEECLYSTDAALCPRLRDLIAGHGLMPQAQRERLRESIEARFGLKTAVNAIDDQIERVVESLL